MSRGKSKPVVVPLHQVEPGQTADVFALLAEKSRGTTRDGKPFFACKFRDARKSVTGMVWADSPFFADCESTWEPGTIYKIRGIFGEHEKYGPKVELTHVREVTESDRDDGLDESQLSERSRFDSAKMFAELRELAAREIADVPLQSLVLALLDRHAHSLRQLPATARHFFPFPGGWLEHTLSVTRSCLLLADRYMLHYPELTPPLNRDLVVAGAILHDIGRVAELASGMPGLPAEPTVDGRLFGHLMLGRDLVRAEAMTIPDLSPERLRLLEHILVSHLALPEWGSPRLPAIPEVLILHHADDLDAKLEMYVRCLTRDAAEGPFTDRDPILGKHLLKQRTV